MLGINTLETDEITFGDGTTMSSTSDFASASDLITYTAGTNVSISVGNVISATDTDTNAEYTASNNGGLSLRQEGHERFTLEMTLFQNPKDPWNQKETIQTLYDSESL